MKIDFELIDKLKFQGAIRINGRALYRAQEYPDWNTGDSTIKYLFYDSWDKKKNILPKPNYLIILYVKMRREKQRDSWVKYGISEYKKGEIQNLETKEKEEIKSVVKLKN